MIHTVSLEPYHLSCTIPCLCASCPKTVNQSNQVDPKLFTRRTKPHRPLNHVSSLGCGCIMPPWLLPESAGGNSMIYHGTAWRAGIASRDTAPCLHGYLSHKEQPLPRTPGPHGGPRGGGGRSYEAGTPVHPVWQGLAGREDPPAKPSAPEPSTPHASPARRFQVIQAKPLPHDQLKHPLPRILQ